MILIYTATWQMMRLGVTDPSGLVFESPQAADKFLTDLAKLMNLTVPKLMANKDFKLLWDILKNSPKMIKLKIHR